MRVHQLHRRQRLPLPPEEAFEFFGDARNLEAITPPWLHFAIVSLAAPELEAGAVIGYRLRLHGIPVRWWTRITAWEPGWRFVDKQTRGPYRLWEHTHTFEPDGEDGTVMSDVVRYALPFGFVGNIAHALLVRRDLRRIFDYREQRVARLLERQAAGQTRRSPASE